MKSTRIWGLWFLCLIFTFPLRAQFDRSFDGTGNNSLHETWGSANSYFVRHTGNGYEDGMSAPAGPERPNPREISNEIFDQPEFNGNPDNISDFGWGFGQFIDHDINFNLDNTSEFMDIPIPDCDPHFDPACTGTEYMHFRRAEYDPLTGTSPDNPRMHMNSITSFLDGSGVYGVDEERSDWLRTHENGKLKSSEGVFLPFNTTTGNPGDPIDADAPSMIIEGPPLAIRFVAGDIRANEQPGLACFHTLFLREHNRLCDSIVTVHPDWTDEQVFQRARKIVGALIQVVAYEEFLPALGIELEPYSGYNPDVNPGIINAFSAAAFRLGHTLVNDQIIRLDNEGDTLSFGSINIKDAFFDPFTITEQGGIESFLKGMATQRQQTFDLQIVHTLRNFLFGPPGAGGLDLVSMNIQRARERGLMDYNSLRVQFGLSPKLSISQISADPEKVALLSAVYESVDDIDPWVGMLAEDHYDGSSIGELVYFILKMQFENLRDGDKFYYEGDPSFSDAQKSGLKNTLLSTIIKRNTNITVIQDDVFHAMPHDEITVDITAFENIRKISIEAYPNPVHDHLNVRIESVSSEDASFNIYDLQGRLLYTEPMQINRGDNYFELALKNKLTSGYYLLSLETADNKGQLKIIKQ